MDEEIYRLTPAFVIATVDKFARLAWRRRRPQHCSSMSGGAAPANTATSMPTMRRKHLHAHPAWLDILRQQFIP